MLYTSREHELPDCRRSALPFLPIYYVSLGRWNKRQDNWLLCQADDVINCEILICPMSASAWRFLQMEHLLSLFPSWVSLLTLQWDLFCWQQRMGWNPRPRQIKTCSRIFSRVQQISLPGLSHDLRAESCAYRSKTADADWVCFGLL